MRIQFVSSSDHDRVICSFDVSDVSSFEDYLDAYVYRAGRLITDKDVYRVFFEDSRQADWICKEMSRRCPELHQNHDVEERPHRLTVEYGSRFPGWILAEFALFENELEHARYFHDVSERGGEYFITYGEKGDAETGSLSVPGHRL